MFQIGPCHPYPGAGYDGRAVGGLGAAAGFGAVLGLPNSSTSMPFAFHVLMASARAIPVYLLTCDNNGAMCGACWYAGACDDATPEEHDPLPAMEAQQSKRQRLDFFDQLSQLMAWKSAGMRTQAQVENAKMSLGL